MLTDPKYIPLKWDSLHINDDLNAEKLNYSTDISLSTTILNKLNKNNSDNSDKSDNSDILNDERHIKVNNYYISKYAAETNILKQIIFFCGLCIIGGLFFMKGLIGESIYIIYLGIIITVGCIYVCSSIFMLYFHLKIDSRI